MAHDHGDGEEMVIMSVVDTEANETKVDKEWHINLFGEIVHDDVSEVNSVSTRTSPESNGTIDFEGEENQGLYWKAALSQVFFLSYFGCPVQGSQ